MKKIIWILVIIVNFVEIVYASDSPLIKNKEVAKVDIKEELWFTPERALYGLGDNYLVYDSFCTNAISKGESPNWSGHSLETYKFYDKNWNELLEHQNILTSESEYFVVDNKLYLFSYDSGTKLTVYNENFEFETYNMDFFDKEYNNFYIQEIVADESNLYILIEHSYKDLYKEIKLYDNYSKYEISDLTKIDIKEKFPKYYNEGSQNIYDEVYYDFSDENVLISGRILVYLENGKVKFNFRDEKYKNYGPAKKYNNLIVAIAYKGEKFKSDILFFDLDGNLISTYEHNAYDIDLLFNNNQLNVATLYIDGICDVVGEGYYTYNHNCTGILMNEIYDLDTEFLGMALGTSEDKNKGEIENPNTFDYSHEFILLCFIASIVITLSLFVKRKNIKAQTS